MSLLEVIATEATKELVDLAAEKVGDFAYKCAPKNAADDEKSGMYDTDKLDLSISHVAILGGEND